MKITINKETITLMNLPKAKELVNDWGETLKDKNTIESLANISCNRNAKLVKVNYIEATLNHFDVTLWAEAILQDNDEIVITSFDVIKANENIAEAFIQVFTKTKQYTV